MKSIFIAFLTFILGGCAKEELFQFEENPKYILAKLMSNNNENILDDVKLFIQSKNDYKKKYKENLEYHGYEDPFDNDFDFTFVLVESLKFKNMAIVVDWKEQPKIVLELINKISNSLISKCEHFDSLQIKFTDTDLNISHFLETDVSEPSITKCADNIGLKLVAIDNGTDSWVLTLIDKKNLSKINHYTKKSNIKLYLNDNGV